MWSPGTLALLRALRCLTVVIRDRRCCGVGVCGSFVKIIGRGEEVIDIELLPAILRQVVVVLGMVISIQMGVIILWGARLGEGGVLAGGGDALLLWGGVVIIIISIIVMITAVMRQVGCGSKLWTVWT